MRSSWKLNIWIHVTLTLRSTASTKSSLKQNGKNALVLTQLVDNMFCRLNLCTIETRRQGTAETNKIANWYSWRATGTARHRKFVGPRERNKFSNHRLQTQLLNVQIRLQYAWQPGQVYVSHQWRPTEFIVHVRHHPRDSEKIPNMEESRGNLSKQLDQKLNQKHLESLCVEQGWIRSFGLIMCKMNKYYKQTRSKVI
jgi:hypothetical protein